MSLGVQTSKSDFTSSSAASDTHGPRRLKLAGLARLVSAVTQRFELNDHERSWGPSKVKRVGVPGGLQLNTRQTLKFVFRWRGTAFKAAMTSWAALVHVAVFVGMWQLATFAQHSLLSDRSIEVYIIEAEVVSAFAFVLAFVLAQYIEFVVHRYNERLSVCIDAGEAALQVALEASVMLRGNKEIAQRLVRYMQLIMHLYYLTIDGPMSDAKWELCRQRGIVEPNELRILTEADGSVSAEPVVVCVWALEIVHTLFLESKLSSDHAVRMETEVSSARRLASRQRDLHEMGPPMPFFHLMTIMVHAFLAVVEFNAAIRLTVGLDAGDGVRMGEILGVATLILSLNTLRRVALAMTNPFGDDETDYDLDYDLRKLWHETKQTIASMPDDGAVLAARSASARADGVRDDKCGLTVSARGPTSCKAATFDRTKLQRASRSVTDDATKTIQRF